MWPLMAAFCLGWITAILAMVIGAAIRELKEKTK